MRRLRTFTEMEQAVLAAMFVHEDALGMSPSLEIGDFSYPLHCATFSELRNLQAALGDDELRALNRSRDIEHCLILVVADALIARARVRRDPHDVDPSLDAFIVGSLGELVLLAPKYGDEFPKTFTLHVRQLRVVALQRQQLMRGAS